MRPLVVSPWAPDHRGKRRVRGDGFLGARDYARGTCGAAGCRLPRGHRQWAQGGTSVDYAAIGAAIVFATFGYKGAEMENISPVYWAGPSVLLSGLVMFVLAKGWIAIVLAQLAMFAAITVVRVMKDGKAGQEKE